MWCQCYGGVVMSPAGGRLLTVREAAAGQRISPMTVLRLIRSGQVRGAYRVGRQWRIPEGAWLEFLTATEASGGDEAAAARP